MTFVAIGALRVKSSYSDAVNIMGFTVHAVQNFLPVSQDIFLLPAKSSVPFQQ